MSGSAPQLHEEDVVRWTEQQSSALRDALDRENLAEEIESLGASQRRELRSQLAVILEHLMKLDRSPAIDPRNGWMDIISRERLNIEDLRQDSPSFRSELGATIEHLKPRVARLATTSLFGYGETIKGLPLPNYTEEQVLGDWLPGEAPLPAIGEREEPT